MGGCPTLACGKRGHPILLSTRYRDEIMTSFDDSGLRGLLQSHPDDIFELSVPTPAVLSDIDRPEDYRRALASFEENTQEGETSNLRRRKK